MWNEAYVKSKEISVLMVIRNVQVQKQTFAMIIKIATQVIIAPKLKEICWNVKRVSCRAFNTVIEASVSLRKRKERRVLMLKRKTLPVKITLDVLIVYARSMGHSPITNPQTTSLSAKVVIWHFKRNKESQFACLRQLLRTRLDLIINVIAL